MRNLAMRNLAVPAIRGSRLALYVAIVVIGFGLLYLLTRTTVPVGDSKGWIEFAQSGDPAVIHYGDPSHFLQMPLVHVVWLMLGAIRVPVEIGALFIAFSWAGTLVAIVFFGRIAAEVLHRESAAWLGAILFGTSLHSLTQWNGELYGLALGFVTAGLFFALRGRILAPALLWVLAVLSHSDFALAAPAFIVAIWFAHPGAGWSREKLRGMAQLVSVAATVTAVVMLLVSWAIGKWSDLASLAGWLSWSYSARHQDVATHPEVFRAIKGLMTAFTVGGHYWRDILSGRGQFAMPFFVPAAVVGLLVLVLSAVFALAAASRRRLFVFGLAWLLPFHVLVNWWFVPTVEKYHGGALPGFVLLVTGGLIAVGDRLSSRRRYLLYAVFVAMCAGLNVFGAVLPMKSLGERTTVAANEIRQLQQERDGRAVFVACDDPKAIREAGVEYLRLRSIWKGSAQEIQRAIVSWADARLREGKEPYVVGRWCLPEEWKTPWAKEPFDLFFLQSSFKMTPTRIVGMPVTESVPTNPFNWILGDVMRLEARTGGRP